ncbi:MAG: M20/M25/M40 family metallo-hydrolase [Acidobacteriota bacterium]|nr:M20/M25/M40 family metallo-hydrolase [Acidobacteriota bacterium]
MKLARLASATLALCLFVPCLSSAAEEHLDFDMENRIRQEGFHNSKVMATASHLMDSIGARLTGSPNMKKANEWTRKQLEEWGLANAHLESWGPFGRGWSYEQCTLRMLAPDSAELLALPVAWSPGTNGPLRASLVRVKLATEEDMKAQKGQLAGKVLLLGDTREVKPQDAALSERYDEKGLSEIAMYEVPGLTPSPRPGRPPFNREEFAKRRRFRRALDRFLADEKVAAVLEPGALDGGTFRVQGVNNGYKSDAPATVPQVMLAIEHFGRLARLLDRKEDVQIELNVRARYHSEDPMAYNTIAEIPGTDKGGQVVMLGGHLDSWHGGTGATDNGAGVAVAMEAVRILKAANARPRRTIRIALWSGEEQGLLGSKAYVRSHFGSRPDSSPADLELPSSQRPVSGPLTIKPEHAKLSAYFNLDNGTGKVRGVYTQENVAVVPIFESWIEPLKDLGVTIVTNRNTSGTDHLSFDEVGLPGFQFIQDEVEYETRTHHTNMDTYERLVREDLMQASVVMASFVYAAANREAPIPRKPLPKDPPRRDEAAPAPAEKGPLAKPERTAPPAAPPVSPTPAPGR